MRKLISNRLLSQLLLVLFFGILFALTVRPLLDLDIWFHIKSGEIIARLGIIHYDVFAYTTKGREWFPYEWLFQILVYEIQQAFGFNSLRFLVAGGIVIQQILLYGILRRYFSTPKIIAVVLCFFFFASTYEYYTARPHIIAYSLLLITFIAIFEYYFKNKWKILFITLPVMLIWANMHASLFLSPLLFFAYAGICMLQFFLKKGNKFKKKAFVLALFGTANIGISILPPLGFTQYRLLIYFWQHEKFLSQFISEWSPLSADSFALVYFSISIFLGLGLLLFALIKSKSWINNLWFVPLLIFFPLAYTASRNVYLAYFSLTFALALAIKLLWSNKKYFLILLSISGTLFVIFHIFLLGQKFSYGPLYYPTQAANFLKKYHINGHMFNEYDYGGYLLYKLYPEYKVFFDGRTDLYIEREMPDYLALSTKKYENDTKYKDYLNYVWNKYDISFVVLSTRKFDVVRRVESLLDTDPTHWALVYWDDTDQIFVRRDGKNDAMIKAFGTSFATPYLRNPYIKDHEQQALQEYEKMDAITPSARTSNAIGYLLLATKKDFATAKNRFEQAISLDPSFESPYMNLAEIAAYNGDLSTAITLYKKAQALAPDRGLIYIRLGQLLLKQGAAPDTVKALWQEGVDQTVDEDAKKTLQQLLGSL